MFSTGTFMTYVLNMWVPILAYLASQAPNWTVGASVYLAFQLFATILFIGIHYGLDREQRVKRTTQNA